MLGLDKIINTAVKLHMGPLAGPVLQALEQFTKDGAEGSDARKVVTRDHRAHRADRADREEGTFVEGYNLEDINDVKELMRAAARGDDKAKGILKDHSSLVDFTVQDFAAGERALSNVSQALFDIDKALINNIRV